MKVYLTFDVEVWCGGWTDLDLNFPGAFERYCYGRSACGEYALPKTLEILQANGLQGVFFVEPLFSARFGRRWLEIIVKMIQAAGQDVQLHLHPEWTDEIVPPIIENVSTKRQHLTYYDAAEQTALIGAGRRLLEQAKGAPITAFRAGGFAANRDTYRALEANGIVLDSSLNACYDLAGGTIDRMGECLSHRRIGAVNVFPVTVFQDGFGRRRPAQVNGCGFSELRAALRSAHDAGLPHFVIVSHNFEMLRPGTSAPDWRVVRRFENLCALLADERHRYEVGVFEAPSAGVAAEPALHRRPSAGWLATAGRLTEQMLRRVG